MQNANAQLPMRIDAHNFSKKMIISPMATWLLTKPPMASKSFYQRFFEDAEKKLNPQVAAESAFGHLSASCSECNSPRIKLIFKAKGLNGISIFLNCQDCQHSENI
jgi:hypothetical protein